MCPASDRREDRCVDAVERSYFMPLEPLAWTLASGLSMLAIAAFGSVFVARRRLAAGNLLPLVALAAGALIGSAFFHLIPAALDELAADAVGIGVVAGFTTFFALEQVLHWHHGHTRAPASARPMTYLIVVGDALHNFVDGLAVAGAFLVDVRLGVTTWFAAAAHEIPQEVGDLAVLMHGGWSLRRALVFNVLSAAAFLLGGFAAFGASATLDVSYIGPFAAGNFLYVGATDLVPEIAKRGDLRANLVHLGMFALGVALMYLAASLEVMPAIP
jgi:zinc and cadmium transporter